MVTMAGKNPDIAKMIEAMTELEYDAIAAYDAAIARFENAEYKTKLQEFVQDHHQHLAGLKQIHPDFNIKDVKGPDAKVVLTKGKVVIANLLGDNAIMAAMVTNEVETVMAYEQACKHENLPENIRALMEKGLQDEMRHKEWMKQAVKDHKQAA